MKTCEDCGFFKEYVNHREMEEQNTDKVIWFWLCENKQKYGKIEDLNSANDCPHYDEDSWMK